jgi:hypothetical protein
MNLKNKILLKYSNLKNKKLNLLILSK